MASVAQNKGSLSLDMECLSLDCLNLPPELTGELGTIPKVQEKKVLSASTATASASTGSGKKRRNRRHRRKAKDSIEPPKAVEEGESSGNKNDRVPLVGAGGEGGAVAFSDFKSVCFPKDMDILRTGTRRKMMGGKRKKQSSSPELKSSENKENKDAETKFDVIAAAKDDDEEGNDEDDEISDGTGRKFLWRNVTKNGWIKKCILVDGLTDGGRPKNGDTVLVKSQGKLKDGTIIDDFPTLVFNVGEHEVIEGLDLAVQSMFKNELSILSVKPEMAYGQLGRKSDVPSQSRITFLFGLLHFEKQKDIAQLTWAQRRKSGQSRMRLANWWYQRKEYPIAVKCYKKALEYYNNIPTNQDCSTPEEYKELLQLMEERLRVMRQVANIFKRIANMIQSGQISS